MEKDNGTPQEYTTPTSLVLGWLLFIFGTIPIFVTLNNGDKNALFIGAGILIAAAVFFIIGKKQSKEQIKRLSERKKTA